MTHQKQSLFYSNMPCFSKMVSIYSNEFPLKGYGFPLEEGFHKWLVSVSKMEDHLRYAVMI
jgi:hypothetical protein